MVDGLKRKSGVLVKQSRFIFDGNRSDRYCQNNFNCKIYFSSYVKRISGRRQRLNIDFCDSGHTICLRTRLRIYPTPCSTRLVQRKADAASYSE